MGRGQVARTAGRDARHAGQALLAARPVRFVVVGATCFVSVLLIFAALRRVLALPVAATLAYAIGAAISFELNRSWTFGQRERSWAQATRFLTITAAAMATNALLVQALAATHDVPELLAEVLSLSCIAPLTFVAYRFWGFRAQDDRLRLGPVTVTGQAGAGSGD
jgi:putative flippase GtrA